MSLGLSRSDHVAVMMVAKGAEALTALDQLDAAVKEYQRVKDLASTTYARDMDRANAVLAQAISGIVLTAQRRIDALVEVGDDDNDDDD